MKPSLHRYLAITLLATSLGLSSQAAPPSGQVDFGKFTPPDNGAEFVEIQIKSNLISLAAQLVEKEQPDAAKIIRSVESIRVNVIGLNDDNREELTKRVQKIRTELEAQGWDSNVNVRGKDGETVGVYSKTRGGDALAGLAITVMDKKTVVLANIVGDIKPSQIAALGESLHIKELKEAGEAIQK